MRRIFDYPQIWLLIFAGAAFLSGRVMPMTTAPRLGWALVAVGLALIALAALTMLRAGATVDPTRKPTALVTHGVYRLSRNPIYLGDLLIIAGLCLVWQPLATILLVPAAMLVIDRLYIRREEEWLRSRDASAFGAWAARTRRWL
jgi:protein-S-isoprenylcysteine O-methyltransferase Ste14